ncbi:hypothetical protein ACET3Z_002923 [Daucus carota]
MYIIGNTCGFILELDFVSAESSYHSLLPCDTWGSCRLSSFNWGLTMAASLNYIGGSMFGVIKGNIYTWSSMACC